LAGRGSITRAAGPQRPRANTFGRFLGLDNKAIRDADLDVQSDSDTEAVEEQLKRARGSSETKPVDIPGAVMRRRALADTGEDHGQSHMQIREKRSLQRQFTLDLGGSTTVTCRECNFTYNSADSGDVNDHDAVHHDRQHGIRCRPGHGLRDQRREFSSFDGHGEHHEILVATRQSPAGVKSLAMAVLELADADLGCQRSNSDIWTAEFRRGVSRFQVYIYLKSNHAVGCLVAERIESATLTFRLARAPGRAFPSPGAQAAGAQAVSGPQDAARSVSAVMGVNKIWVVAAHRGSGIGELLMDTARKSFLGPGMPALPLRQVAFTELTSAGSCFVEHYVLSRGPTVSTAVVQWLTYGSV
jgi:hypothetical protein